MDSTRQVKSIRLAADSGYCLVRSTADQQRQLERLLYRRYPTDEWGTFFRFGYRKTPWGLFISFVDLLPPARGDFDDRSPLVEFSAGYINRALNSFDDSSFGLGFIHSHPEDCASIPSSADDDMDSYFAAEFEKFSEGRPYISLIASRAENGQKQFSGRCFFRGEWLPVSNWLISGTDVLKRERDIYSVRAPSKVSPVHERVRQLFGDHAGSRLQGAVIGIVGCSGLGTPAAHVLARAGIGEFVLVDSGKFKASNHERNHASRSSDLKNTDLKKVDLLKRLIHEVDPDTRVTSICADILDQESLDQLIRCDIVLGCTDSYYARAALGDIATHYAVPVLDLAVQMRSGNGMLTEQVGEIARYLPGLPCPWCRNRITAANIRAETATEAERAQAARAAAAALERGVDGAQYWIGEKPQEWTVGYMTTAVAAIGAGYVQNWLTGAASMPHDRFQFDLGKSALAVVDDNRTALPGCSCQRCIGHADQGRVDFTVSKPA